MNKHKLIEKQMTLAQTYDTVHEAAGAAGAPDAIECPLASEDIFVLQALHNTYPVHGQVEVGKDTISWVLELPEKISYDGLVIFISGLGAAEPTSRPFRNASAQAGYATLTYSPARRDNKSLHQRISDPQELHVDTLTAISHDVKASKLVKHYMPKGNQIDLGKKLMIPHSMGGLSTVEYALQEPETIDKVISLATTGYGSPTLAALVRSLNGILPSLRHELIPAMANGNIELSWSSIEEILRHILVRPSQTLSEGFSCLTRDVRPKMKQLRDMGVHTGYLAFQHDTLVPAQQQTADYVDDYKLMLNAGHMAPQRKPAKVVAEVRAMHDRLN